MSEQNGNSLIRDISHLTPFRRLAETLSDISQRKEYFALLFLEDGWIIPHLLQSSIGISIFYNRWFFGIVETLKETFCDANRDETIRQLKMLGFTVDKMHVPSALDSSEWWVIWTGAILMPAAPVYPEISEYRSKAIP